MSAVPEYRDLERFRAILTERLGLHFDDTKTEALAETLDRRVKANGGVCTQYLHRLSSPSGSREELRELARELTVTETYFFRHHEQLDVFVELLLERLAARGDSSKLRILSAGCASGEEPYSLAILARETAPTEAHRVSIAAIDVCPSALEKAGNARYSNWSLREASPAQRARWFESEGDGYALDPAIRDAVRFSERNLVVGDTTFWQTGSYDVVFCRNVLMYFDPMQAQAVVGRIAQALVPGGYLFLGHAESLRGLSNDFHLCHTHGTFYYRRKSAALQPVDVDLTARRQDPPMAATLYSAATWIDTVQRASDRIQNLAAASTLGAGTSPSPASTRTHRAPDLQHAVELMRAERYDQTLALLDALPVEHARDPEVLLLRALSLSHSGAITDAEGVCRELLERDEFNAGAHYVLALCREGSGDVAGALEHDQVAIYLDPGFAMPRLHIGLIARRQGAWTSARQELGQALLLLQREDASRVLLFGGGFNRGALVALCQAELNACAARP